jgi:5'-nucleotidase (lipoprotein e(P4) family)
LPCARPYAVSRDAFDRCAKGFIDFAEHEGVAVVYISNRLTRYAAATEAALRHLGIAGSDLASRLLLRDRPSGDKSGRREQAEKRYRVLLFFGDNLRDFSEEFVAPKLNPDDYAAQRAAMARRKEQVVKAATHFGDDWIILPNPMYGEWLRLLGRDPRADLDAANLGPARR